MTGNKRRKPQILTLPDLHCTVFVMPVDTIYKCYDKNNAHNTRMLSAKWLTMKYYSSWFLCLKLVISNLQLHKMYRLFRQNESTLRTFNLYQNKVSIISSTGIISRQILLDLTWLLKLLFSNGTVVWWPHNGGVPSSCAHCGSLKPSLGSSSIVDTITYGMLGQHNLCFIAVKIGNPVTLRLTRTSRSATRSLK